MTAMAVGIVSLVFVGLLLVATIVGSVLFAAGRPRSGVSRVGRAIATVCGSALALLIVLAVCMLPMIQQAREEARRSESKTRLRELGEKLHHRAEDWVVDKVNQVLSDEPAASEPNADAGLTRLPDKSTAAPPVDALKPLTGHDDRTVVSAGKRPEWTQPSETKTGDVTQIVLSSKQYSTIDEARAELAITARKLLGDDFQQYFRVSPSGLGELSADTVKLRAVRREYVETVERDFGNFFAPMHRVWWQLELSPAVRSELYAEWKIGAKKARAATVAGTLLAATTLFAGLSLFNRRRPAVIS